MSSRPTTLSGVLAVVAAAAGVAAVAETQPLRIGAAATGAGLVVFVLGAVLARSRSRALGGVIALAGFAGAAGGAAYGASTASTLHLAIVAPGTVGAFLVALGVAPLYGTGSRRFVKMACWLVFLGPVLSAGTEYAEPEVLYDVARILGRDGRRSVGLGPRREQRQPRKTDRDADPGRSGTRRSTDSVAFWSDVCQQASSTSRTDTASEPSRWKPSSSSSSPSCYSSPSCTGSYLRS